MLNNKDNYSDRSILGSLYKLLITEQIIIYLLLEQLIDNCNQKSTKKNKFNIKNSSICDQLIGKTDAHTAEYSKNIYIKAKQVYLSKNKQQL
jgi:hypothetical protein